MEIRHIRRDEYELADWIKHICFGRKVEVQKNDADEPDAIFQSLIACYENGEMVARVRNIDYRCTFDGQVVPAAGLSGVASLPQSRNRGNIRAIVSTVFGEDRARGVPFGVLFPFSHAYYRRFGYELVSEQQTAELSTESLRAYAGLDFSVRMHSNSDGFDQIRAVSEKMNACYNLGMHLSDRQFLKALGGDALVYGDYRYILYKAGKPVAYLYHTDEQQNGEGIADVKILEYTGLDGLLCTLGFLYSLRARYKRVLIPLPSDVSFLRLLPEPKDVKLTVRPYGMARILDVSAVLSAMRHPWQSGTYSIEVADDMIQDNDGIYIVSFGGGKVMVEKAPATAADMKVDIGTLTQLVLGFATPEQVSHKPGVALMSNYDTLSAVFVHKPTLLSFHF